MGSAYIWQINKLFNLNVGGSPNSTLDCPTTENLINWILENEDSSIPDSDCSSSTGSFSDSDKEIEVCEEYDSYSEVRIVHSSLLILYIKISFINNNCITNLLINRLGYYYYIVWNLICSSKTSLHFF